MFSQEKNTILGLNLQKQIFHITKLTVVVTDWPKCSYVATSWPRNHDLQVYDQTAHPRQVHRPTSRENLFCGAWVVHHRIFATKISILWRTSTCATEIRNYVAHQAIMRHRNSVAHYGLMRHRIRCATELYFSAPQKYYRFYTELILSSVDI
jgi:hypothetical protein